MSLVAKIRGALGTQRILPRDRRVAAFVMSLGGLSVGILFASAWLVVTPILKARKAAQRAAQAEAHHEDGHGGEEAKELISIARDIPKEILDRQDGVMEPGHDLVDPEFQETRGLASIIKDPPPAGQLPYRFVELDEVFSGSKVGMRAGGAVIAEIVLEIDSIAGEQEAIAMKSQFRSAIASIVSEYQQKELLTLAGKARLKRDIQKELNLRLKQGKIKDVLFSSLIIR